MGELNEEYWKVRHQLRDADNREWSRKSRKRAKKSKKRVRKARNARIIGGSAATLASLGTAALVGYWIGK